MESPAPAPAPGDCRGDAPDVPTAASPPASPPTSPASSPSAPAPSDAPTPWSRLTLRRTRTSPSAALWSAGTGSPLPPLLARRRSVPPPALPPGVGVRLPVRERSSVEARAQLGPLRGKARPWGRDDPAAAGARLAGGSLDVRTWALPGRRGGLRALWPWPRWPRRPRRSPSTCPCPPAAPLSGRSSPPSVPPGSVSSPSTASFARALLPGDLPPPAPAAVGETLAVCLSRACVVGRPGVGRPPGLDRLPLRLRLGWSWAWDCHGPRRVPARPKAWCPGLLRCARSGPR
nr:proline-rich receptor-like protein kinase PERK14 [Aegilops tauschii subsp. strangulata]